MPVSPELLIPLLQRREELEIQQSQIQLELHQVTAAIKSLSEEYNNENRFNWSEKAVRYITSANQFLQTNDILEKILPADVLNDERKRRGSLVALSVALNNLCNRGVLRKIVIQGIKGHYYGLPAWFNGDDIVKDKIVQLMAVFGKINDPVKINTTDLTVDNASEFIK